MSARMSASDELQRAIINLAHWSKRAQEEDGLTTTAVIVVENSDGNGRVNVYVNGDLQEKAVEIGMTAAEVNRKALRFMHAVSRGQVEQAIEIGA